MPVTTHPARSRSARAGLVLRLALLAALPAGLLLAGCTEDSPAVGAEPSASATGTTGTAASVGASTDVRTTVGPLLLGVPDYWQVGATSEGTTLVTAHDCAEGEACPAFVVLQADAVAADFDPAQAYTADATGCPGGLEPQAGDGQAQVTPIVIDGVDGTLSTFEVDCATPEGEVRMSVPQTQWSLPDAPGGAVLVVDRWSFDGLGSRVAGAAWATTTG